MFSFDKVLVGVLLSIFYFFVVVASRFSGEIMSHLNLEYLFIMLRIVFLFFEMGNQIKLISFLERHRKKGNIKRH